MNKPDYLVYEDGIISVGLFANNARADKINLLNLGMCWLPPAPYKNTDGKIGLLTNIMDGETDWFLCIAPAES